jgi:hypothetical protein
MQIRGIGLSSLLAAARPAAAQPGLLDRVELRRQVVTRPELVKLLFNMRRDMPRVEGFLQRHQEAGVFVLGSARAEEGSEDFRKAEDVGKSLAHVNEDPIGGGGPSLMWAVPRAFKEERRQIAPFENAPRTLAVALELPHETGVNPAVDDSEVLSEFLFRKLALIRNSRAFLALPGGIGTLDEVFEIWAQTSRDQHKGPLGFTQTRFWKPILNRLYDVAVRERSLIGRDCFERVDYTDDHDDFLHRLPPWATIRKGQEPFAVTSARLQQEITETVQALDDRPEAVAVLGGRGLAADDPVLDTVRELSRMLSGEQIELRVGNPPQIARAVTEGADGAPVQALKLKDEEMPSLPGLEVLAEQTDFISHRELLTRSARGMVYAPGGLGTLSSLFAVLTQIQTGKRPEVPIVLVGTNFWKPIFQAIEESMLNEHRRYISPEDLGLVTITDDPRHAYQVLTGRLH